MQSIRAAQLAPHTCCLLLLCCAAVQGLVEYLGFDLGELFDSAGILPSDLLYYDGEEEDDDAASTSSGGSGTSSVYGPSGPSVAAAGAAAGGGWGSAGGGGGVRDLAAIMMFQPRRLKMLKRRYEQLLRISLQVGAACCPQLVVACSAYLNQQLLRRHATVHSSLRLLLSARCILVTHYAW